MRSHPVPPEMAVGIVPLVLSRHLLGGCPKSRGQRRGGAHRCCLRAAASLSTGWAGDRPSTVLASSAPTEMWVGLGRQIGRAVLER